MSPQNPLTLSSPLFRIHLQVPSAELLTSLTDGGTSLEQLVGLAQMECDVSIVFTSTLGRCRCSAVLHFHSGNL
jgi:hypothetical protein